MSLEDDPLTGLPGIRTWRPYGKRLPLSGSVLSSGACVR